jgi:transcriptional regulator with XRE-family HTH domain
MKNATIWPRLIAQYRKRHVLTQGEFALRFGVTQQTVSRWEAGVQAPHLEAQATLRAALGLGAISDSEAWIARVNETFGNETLFDSQWRVVAVSASALKYSTLTRAEILGRRVSDLVAMREVGPQLEQLPIFDGNFRALKASFDVRVPSARLRRDADIWLVLTSDEKLFAHVAAYDTAAPQVYSGPAGTTVISIHAVLLDGSIVDLAGRAVAS